VIPSSIFHTTPVVPQEGSLENRSGQAKPILWHTVWWIHLDPAVPSFPLPRAEEDAVVDAVRFLYCGQLTTRAAADLIRLVLVADRFQIPTCIQAACGALADILQQYTSASPWKVVRLLAALPDSVQNLPAVSDFLTKAQKAMSEYYKDFQALAAAPNGLSELSVSGLQMVLEGDDLEIDSEAVVFEAVRAWVRARFEGAEERRYAMAQLAPSIRFLASPPRSSRRIVTSRRWEARNAGSCTRRPSSSGRCPSARAQP
jgi:hypothetical protein